MFRRNANPPYWISSVVCCSDGMENCTDTYDTFCSTPSLKFPTESEHTKDNTQWKRGPAIWLERLVAGLLPRWKFSIPGISFLHSNSTFSCQYHCHCSTLIHSYTHHRRYMVYSLKLASDSVLEQHIINQSLTMWKFRTMTTVSFLNYLRMLFELDAASNKMEQSRGNVSRQGFGTNIF